MLTTSSRDPHTLLRSASTTIEPGILTIPLPEDCRHPFVTQHSWTPQQTEVICRCFIRLITAKEEDKSHSKKNRKQQ